MAVNKFDLIKNVQVTQAEPIISGGSVAGKTPRTQIEISKLVPFDKQPFKPYSDKELVALAESIKTYGVIVPIIARPCQSKFQIISGHNRYLAAKLLGLSEIPVDIRPMDDDTAALTLVETNFTVRTSFLHSEKAKAYKLQYEAKKHQGTSGTMCKKSISSEEMAAISDDCERRIRQYVKMAELCDELLDLLDSGKLPFLCAYNLSFLSLPAQHIVLDFLTKGNELDVALSEKIKEIGDDITEEFLLGLINERPAQKISSIKISFKSVKQYFQNSETEEEITKTILKALEKYYSEADNG